MSVYIVGDVHGHLIKLIELLIGAKLIDEEHRWSGGNAHLWFMGDFFDRGPHAVPFGLAGFRLLRGIRPGWHRDGERGFYRDGRDIAVQVGGVEGEIALELSPLIARAEDIERVLQSIGLDAERGAGVFRAPTDGNFHGIERLAGWEWVWDFSAGFALGFGRQTWQWKRGVHQGLPLRHYSMTGPRQALN